MKDFELPDYHESIGGCRKFTFAPLICIQFVPDAVNGVISDPIILKGILKMLEGYSSPESLSYAETAKQTASGLLYTATLKAFYPGYNREMIALFDEMLRHKFVLLVTDLMGITRMVGSLKEPLSFYYDFVSMNKPSERMGYNYGFEGNLTVSSPVYEP